VEVINKVVITEEAQFDYESVVDTPMPKTDIKIQCELYIDNKQSLGRLLWERYFRCTYLDEESGKKVMLFIYKGDTLGKMQLWMCKGVCAAEDWSEDLEDSGQIRDWLNTAIDPAPTEDWVWNLRLWQQEQRQQIEKEYREIGDATMEYIKSLLGNYKLNKTKIEVSDSEEAKKLREEMDFLDRCIQHLEDEAKEILTSLYIKGLSMSQVGKRLGYSKACIFKKRDRALKVLELLFEGR